MPLLTELGEEIFGHMGADAPAVLPNLPPSDFENWLSFLAEDDPWLREEDRLRNRSIFLRVSALLYDVISHREIAARRDAPPDWLRMLIARWHEDKSSVITFNYDTLVEAAFTDVVRVYSGRGDERTNYVSPSQIFQAPLTPISARAGAVWVASAISTFRLLKLHGSRTWLYSGRESFFGEAIYDATSFQSWAGEERHPRPWLGADKVPLVVPPTSGKTGFFNNETVRLQWRLAYEALQEADRIFIVGYSLPPTDLLTRFLLQAGSRPGTTVVAVNRDGSVVDRLAQVLSASKVESIIQPDALRRLAESLPPSTQEPLVYLHE
jgi:NAD-dependent SIR2 family protein deacetylase